MSLLLFLATSVCYEKGEYVNKLFSFIVENILSEVKFILSTHLSHKSYYEINSQLITWIIVAVYSNIYNPNIIRK